MWKSLDRLEARLEQADQSSCCLQSGCSGECAQATTMLYKTPPRSDASSPAVRLLSAQGKRRRLSPPGGAVAGAGAGAGPVVQIAAGLLGAGNTATTAGEADAGAGAGAGAAWAWQTAAGQLGGAGDPETLVGEADDGHLRDVREVYGSKRMDDMPPDLSDSDDEEESLEQKLTHQRRSSTMASGAGGAGGGSGNPLMPWKHDRFPTGKLSVDRHNRREFAAPLPIPDPSPVAGVPYL